MVSSCTTHLKESKQSAKKTGYQFSSGAHHLCDYSDFGPDFEAGDSAVGRTRSLNMVSKRERARYWPNYQSHIFICDVPTSKRGLVRLEDPWKNL